MTQCSCVKPRDVFHICLLVGSPHTYVNLIISHSYRSYLTLHRAFSEASAATEPAWEGAGKEVGVQIWRVEV